MLSAARRIGQFLNAVCSQSAERERCQTDTPAPTSAGHIVRSLCAAIPSALDKDYCIMATECNRGAVPDALEGVPCRSIFTMTYANSYMSEFIASGNVCNAASFLA